MKPTHYIVLLRGPMDDVPMLVTHDAVVADQVARTLSPVDPTVELVLQTLGIDFTPFGTAVVTVGENGVPMGMEDIKEVDWN